MRLGYYLVETCNFNLQLEMGASERRYLFTDAPASFAPSAHMGVQIIPGQTVFTLMLKGAKCMAIDWVRLITPALLAE